MSILDSSPNNNRFFSAEIAEALGDINAAVIVQQLHYWMTKEKVGKTIDGVKWVYNSFNNWVVEQFKWLSVWQFRKSMNLLRSLDIVLVKRHKSKQWNQTNYYSLNYESLFKLLKWKMAESTETVEMCVSAAQGEVSSTLDLRNNDLSFKETKTTFSDLAAKQVAAARPKKALKTEEIVTKVNEHSEQLTAPKGQENINSVDVQSNIDRGKKVAQVDYIVNKKWKKLIPELDAAGIPVNKTVISLLKMYSSEEVKGAIAIFKARKRDKHIPNPSGYFVAALEQDYSSKQIISPNNSESFGEIDMNAVFRHWYDLAKELGYCSGQDISDGDQWVCISGSWEKWSDAVERGYSLDYLKKIMKRSQG